MGARALSAAAAAAALRAAERMPPGDIPLSKHGPQTRQGYDRCRSFLNGLGEVWETA